MKSGKSYIKDTGDFLDKIKELGPVPLNSFIVTADVIGLYPSIPHDEGIKILEKKLDLFSEKVVPTEDIIKLTEFVLKNNIFEFDSKIMQQISGTANGTTFAPSYACIFLDYIENEFMENEPLKPWVWYRYIDDIFFIWTGSELQLEGFLERLNNWHPNLKFTSEKSRHQVNFLDVIIKKQGQNLLSDLFIKPTDGHQYLHFDSCHPNHVKNSIVYSQALRIKRICSSNNDFNGHLKNLTKWFLERGYPENSVKKQIEKAKNTNLDKKEAKNKEKCGAVPFVITYNKRFDNLNSKLRKHCEILFLNEEVKQVFSPPPFVSFRTARNLKSHLVRAKLYPLERKTGSAKCNKNYCKVCDNVTDTKTFTGPDNSIYQINHYLTCDDKNLVYLLSCKTCGIRYVGQTSNKFRYRWNNYKDNNRKAEMGLSHMQPLIYQHFKGENHNGFLEDCNITFIDKTDASDPTRREQYWIRVLNTNTPSGLNISETN